MNINEKTKPSAGRKYSGRTRVFSNSIQWGIDAATNTEPVSEVTASQRQGNCTSDSLGINCHNGWLNGSVMKNEKIVTIETATKRFRPFPFQIKTMAGRKRVIVASARRFAYHVFRLVNAAGEKMKLTR